MLVHKQSVRGQYDIFRVAERRRAAGQDWHCSAISAALVGDTVVVALTYGDGPDQITFLNEETVFDKPGIEANFQFFAVLANSAPLHISD